MGLTLALFSAVCLSLADTGKKILAKDLPPYLVIWVCVSVALVVNSAYLAVSGFHAPELLGLAGIWCTGVSLMLICEILFIRALSSGEISLSVPFTAFIPVFAALFAFLVYGESPSSLAILGILVLVLGSWLMFFKLDQHFLDPFKAMLRLPGPKLVLITTVINGVLIALLKFGGQQSSPVFFLTSIFAGEWIVLSVVLGRSFVSSMEAIFRRAALCLGTGLLWSIGMLAFYEAINFTYISYASAVQRLHLIFVVMIGYFLLGEGDIRRRLGGCLVMLFGVALVILAQ